jgi:predicted DNA-binding transcriptional regulator AlpA
VKINDVWGVKQVAEATGLGRRTVHTLKTYGALPPPDLVRSNRPLWTRSTIRGWCMGRIPDVNGHRKQRTFNEDYEPDPLDVE